MIEAPTDNHPWERQIDGASGSESEEAFSAFRAYRDIPLTFPEYNRSLRLANLIHLGKDPRAYPVEGNNRIPSWPKARTQFHGWSSQWEWGTRAWHYDQHLDRQRIELSTRTIVGLQAEAVKSAREALETLRNAAFGVETDRIYGVTGSTRKLGAREQMAALLELIKIAGLGSTQKIEVEQRSIGAGATVHVLQREDLVEAGKILSSLGVIPYEGGK